MIDPASRLIVALDVPTVAEARALTNTLSSSVSFYKIGLELLFRGGMDLAAELMAEGHQVFIDAKLLDIGNTVERATAAIAKSGASFLTVHGTDSKTLKAAVKGRGDERLGLLAVTVMTNLDDTDLTEQGILQAADTLVLHRAKLAAQCGFDGIVASAHEAKSIRSTLGSDLKIITPGIRPTGSDKGDQTRIMTPTEAISAGSDYLVVGRPITQANDPKTAATNMIAEMSTAFAQRK